VFKKELKYDIIINVTENVLILQCHVEISKETLIQQSWFLEKKDFDNIEKELKAPRSPKKKLSPLCFSMVHVTDSAYIETRWAFEEQPYHSQSQVNSYEIVMVCKISTEAEGQQCGAISYNKWEVIC
jgi:hypothetical protein